LHIFLVAANDETEEKENALAEKNANSPFFVGNGSGALVQQKGKTFIRGGV